MILLDCNCNWQNVIDGIPCLCWGVIFLIALYLILKYVAQPIIQHLCEVRAKDKSNKREEDWYKLKNENPQAKKKEEKQSKDIKEADQKQ